MQFRPCPFRAEASGRKFPQSSGKCSFFRLRQKDGHGDLGAIVRVPEQPAALFQLQLHAIKERIGAVEPQYAPRAKLGNARVVQRVLRGLRVRAAKAARAQKNPAKVPRHDAQHILHALAFEHVQNRLTGRALRLAVIAVALLARMQDVGPAVVPRVVFLLLTASSRALASASVVTG